MYQQMRCELEEDLWTTIERGLRPKRKCAVSRKMPCNRSKETCVVARHNVTVREHRLLSAESVRAKINKLWNDIGKIIETFQHYKILQLYSSLLLGRSKLLSNLLKFLAQKKMFKTMMSQGQMRKSRNYIFFILS